jgi:hypothetical protein
MEINSELCTKCKGRGFCGKQCKILAKFSLLGKPSLHFSGNSPPEVFIGRVGYPEINTGILSPQENCDSEELSLPEIWHSKNFSIEKIIESRGKMVYARFKSKISDARKSSRLVSVMQEVSLASKPVSTEFFLKKLPKNTFNLDSHAPIIGNPAPLKFARLEENPPVDKKVEYITQDTDVKATRAILELYRSNIRVSSIIKLLSAGMLGTGIRRKLVPTRWAITATDDTVSKILLEKIRFYPENSE